MKKYLLPLLVMSWFFVGNTKPVVIQYGTYLTDQDNNPRTNITGRTTYFRLYNAQAGGEMLWEESQTVTVTNGFLSVFLGSVNAIPFDVVDTVSSLWLEMELATEQPFSRQRITTSFYTISAVFADTAKYAVLANSAIRSDSSAFADRTDSLGNRPATEYALATDIPTIPTRVESSAIAGTADSVGGTPAGRLVRANASGDVGIGTSNPQANLHVAGFTVLGDSGMAPKVKMKLVKAVVDSNTNWTELNVPHNLTIEKILSATCLIHHTVLDNVLLPPLEDGSEWGDGQHSYNFRVTDTEVQFRKSEGGGLKHYHGDSVMVMILYQK